MRSASAQIAELTRCESDDRDAPEDARRRLLAEELSHRVRNMLAVVGAMARQTLVSTPDPEVFVEKFLRRIEALGRTHGLLSREQWGDVQLCDVVWEVLAPCVAEVGAARVSVDGPPVALHPKAAVALGLVLHELAANALGHGALSVPDGRLVVAWDGPEEDGPTGGRIVTLDWTESGGPSCGASPRVGFGGRLIARVLAHDLGGSADLAYGAAGLCARLTFPTLAPSASAPPALALIDAEAAP